MASVDKVAYMKYRKIQEKAGSLYQDFIVDLAWSQGLAITLYSSEEYQKGIGESRTGAEIKYDRQYAKTGNIYIEVAEKARPRPGNYAPAGIYAPKRNTWLYIIGDYNIVFLFLKKILILLDKNGRYRRVEKPTSQAFLIPDADARKYAEIWNPNAKEKVGDLIENLAEAAKELNEIAKQNPNQLTLFRGK